MFRGILLVCMAPGPKKTKAAKKQAAKKKSVLSLQKQSKQDANITPSASKQEIPKETKTLASKPLPKIYNDSKFTKHPTYPTNDLVKVLVRSPKEAFVFWKFSPATLERVRNELDVPSTNSLTFRLKVEYQNVFGSDRVEWYDLPPFTESYYLKFMFPVRNVQCMIFVSNGVKEIPSLHATGKDLPQGTESFRLDKEWIHPQWIQEGLVTESPGGEFYFRDENASAYYVNPRNQTGNRDQIPNPKPNEILSFANGSGSGKGIL
ncbi:hypothetical protein [Leptospira jelokensis]|uniref:hypothetical protein n=1 Tax=Leptospira jelokensis TaxID=2484931 RepID=UPI001090F2E8|nr:hypothetical protein [Leptospira jelokensis]TGM03854.1 hypothetical protein EHQ79_06040 [Leptospira jelokensis]